ncbi:MAG TPA: amidohydrolase family protein [Acidimicrobiia bacterium]|nr:amidohydrolase family protein [Acidimicrobiia bacterium]
MDVLEGSADPLTFACARIVNGEGGQSASPAWITIADGRIVATGSGSPPPGARDLGDATIAPGLLDVQVNGCGDVEFATASVDEIVAAVDGLRAAGTTGVLLTVCTAPLEAYDSILARLAAVQSARPASVLGVHLEGPFLGEALGAHPAELVRHVDLIWLEELCDRFGKLVRMVTLSPEADAGALATRALVARGIVVALGHSTADYETALAFAGAGATVATHLFNGMGPMHHRAPGLAGAALTHGALVPSLIADFVHVHPAIVELVLRARADTVLVSDAVPTAATYLEDGTLAGSDVTLWQCVEHVLSLDLPLPRAIRCATANPARVLGLSDRGRIAPGARADLLALRL